MNRSDWTGMTDAQLLAQCAVDTYRASGPGGQKRNKTSSAVRLRHQPTGLIVIAEESRSQHENKARALRRLRKSLWLDLRLPIDAATIADHHWLSAIRNLAGRFVASPRRQNYLPATAIILDGLDFTKASVREAGQLFNTTTANLIDFLKADEQVWRAVNALRVRHGKFPLHA